MKILGLWDGHNASAAAVDDGRIVAAVAEERLTRRKMQRGFPHQALPVVLSLAGWVPADVDIVAVAGRYGRLPLRLLDGRYTATGVSPGPMALPQRLFRHAESLVAGLPGIRDAESALSAATLRRRLLAFGFSPHVPVTLVPHHPAHAAGAASMLSGDGIVLTMDGYGDGLWATLHRHSGATLSRLDALPYLSSIAVTYGSVCQILGFREGDEGKVTALAASGDPAPLLPLFLGRFGMKQEAGRTGAAAWAGRYPRLFPGGVPDRADVQRILAARPQDVAAALQEACERFVLAYMKARLPGPPAHLALAGGLFANVSINRKVSDSLPQSDIHVFPPMTDQGLSLGAALAVARAKHVGPIRFDSPFLGATISPSAAVRAAHRRGLGVQSVGRPERRCAEVLARGGTVAVVSGREEFGPRALGNRSLLFAANSPELADRIQEMLRRSRIMPFAPVCREVRAAALFLPPWPAPSRTDLGLGYMTFAVRARPDTRVRFPAAVHCDGTARVQVVTRERNSRLYTILQAYEDLTGLPLLINTSFNLHGEPIVHAHEDALDTFVACRADLMLLDDLLVTGGGTP